jgi:NTP pyrophosphatase (non-canonical NTP hydrolase)
MEADYIDSLRMAYDQFFSVYNGAPVLIIDTNALDFVQNSEDRDAIFGQIRSALGEGPQQPALPGMETGQAAVPVMASEHAPLDQSARRLGDFQRFHQQLDHEKQFSTDPFFNFILLQEEMGELARAFRHRWRATAAGQPDDSRVSIQEELADVLAYVLKLANYTGIDLEEAYLRKMQLNERREWLAPAATESENS